MTTRSKGELQDEQVSLAPIVVTATGVGAAVDVSNHITTRHIIQSGVITDGTSYTWKVTESATSGGTYTDVATGQHSGDAAFLAADDGAVKHIDVYAGAYPFQKLAVTVIGSPSTGGVFSAVATSKPKVSS